MKTFCDKYIKNWNMSDHYQKNTYMIKNKFYVLFAGFKNYLYDKRTQTLIWNCK